jgi:hypothetical protein
VSNPSDPLSPYNAQSGSSFCAQSQNPEAALSRCVREIIEFVDADGWGQPPTMFGLAPTALLAVAEPSLQGQLDDGAELTPIEQEPMPEDIEGGLAAGSSALSEFLATTSWPPSVVGAVLVQEVVVAPSSNADERRRARLVVGVLRDGPSLSLLQLQPGDDDDPYAGLELRTGENLAGALVRALYDTFDTADDE